MRRLPFPGFLAALLPAAERDDLARRHDADPAPWSFLLGLAELYLGAKLLLANALTAYQAMTAGLADYLFEHVDPRQLDSFDAKLAVTQSGTVVWLTWALRPTTWLLASVPLVGIARLVAFAAGRETVGEPLVWLFLRAAQGVRALCRALERRRRFGPERPDRLLPDPNGALVVLACRPKPDWNERVTIRIGERFYRLHRVEERRDRGFWAHAYLLHEADPNEIFRGLVGYEPPGP